MQYDSLFDLFTELISSREEEEVFEGETLQTSRGDCGTPPVVDSSLPSAEKCPNLGDPGREVDCSDQVTCKAGIRRAHQKFDLNGDLPRSPIIVADSSRHLITKNDTQTSSPSTGESGEDSQGLNQNDSASSNEIILHSCFCPDKPDNDIQNFPLFSTHHITPSEEIEFGPLPSIRPSKCNCAFWRRQAESIQSAKSELIDSMSFIHMASRVGWANAEFIAAIWKLKVDPSIRPALENNTPVAQQLPRR